jgi:hypothetical protein
VDEPLRILILGQSNSGGVQLVDPIVSWPNLLANGLPEVIGRPVALTMRPFFAHAPGSIEYLDREIARHEPDLVFLMLTTFSFTNPVLAPAVRRRFGDRAGRQFSQLVERMDSATRHRGPIARWANRTVRAGAVAAFRARPVTTYEAALDGTLRALERLARQEDTEVVAFHGFTKLPGPRGGREAPATRMANDFFREVQVACQRLHVAYLNMQGRPETLDPSWYFPDGVHVTAAAHQGVAAFALAAFRDGRISAGSLRTPSTR